MKQSVAILGRQPALGIAELESLYGAGLIEPFGNAACFIDRDTSAIDFGRLGGSVRLATVIEQLPSPHWRDIEKHLLDTMPKRAAEVEGKLSFGISVYGVKTTAKHVARTALLMKKAIKAAGSSVRMVPHSGIELNSAVVLHNKLYRNDNWELLIISDGKKAYLAQTRSVQDIDAYAARDQGRPMRDAKVGMLPPKLAQIIINLSVGKIVSHESRVMGHEETQTESVRHPSSTLHPTRSPLVLDAFCGTGVVLQEATLMDYDVYGTDIEPRMVQYSIDNLTWLDEQYPDAGDYRRVEIADATTHKWEIAKFEAQNSKLFVACETFLGKPLSTLPPADQLATIMREANEINHKFLRNIAPQLKSGTRLCVAVPTWRGKKEFLHLSALDYLGEMGYNRLDLEHVLREDLIYHREGQVVARELLILQKK